jgi:hypothetical protein
MYIHYYVQTNIQKKALTKQFYFLFYVSLFLFKLFTNIDVHIYACVYMCVCVCDSDHGCMHLCIKRKAHVLRIKSNRDQILGSSRTFHSLLQSLRSHNRIDRFILAFSRVHDQVPSLSADFRLIWCRLNVTLFVHVCPYSTLVQLCSYCPYDCI